MVTMIDAVCLPHADYRSDVSMDFFCEKLHNLFRTEKRGRFVILAGNMNIRISQLSSSKLCLGVPFGLDFFCFECGERLLVPCWDHRLFFDSTNFGNKNNRQPPDVLRFRDNGEPRSITSATSDWVVCKIATRVGALRPPHSRGVSTHQTVHLLRWALKTQNAASVRFQYTLYPDQSGWKAEIFLA